METSELFAFTSRLTAGLSFDKKHYDVLTGYFTPNANLPRSGAQQLLRARDIKLRSGFFTVTEKPNIKMMVKPLGYDANKDLCNSREDFSCNLLDDWGCKMRTLRVRTPESMRPLYYHLQNERAIAARPKLYKKILCH